MFLNEAIIKDKVKVLFDTTFSKSPQYQTLEYQEFTNTGK